MLSVRYASRNFLVRGAQQLGGLKAVTINAMDRPTDVWIQHSCLSTTAESKGPWGWITSKIGEREKSKQEEQLREQIKRMADSERWTLKDFGNDLDKSLTGWRMHVPGLKDTKEIQQAKTAQGVVKAFIEEAGEDASCEDIRKLGRTEKLRVSYRGGISIEEVNVMIQQFEVMDMMHKILRYRVKNGKSLPVDQVSMQAAMQTDGKHAFDKSTKQAMVAKRNPFGRRGKVSSAKKF